MVRHGITQVRFRVTRFAYKGKGDTNHPSKVRISAAKGMMNKPHSRALPLSRWMNTAETIQVELESLSESDVLQGNCHVLQRFTAVNLSS